MDVDGPHHRVALPVVELLAEGMAEVLVGDETMAAVDFVDEPGKSAGEFASALPGEGLEDANEDTDQQVDCIIGEARASPGHSFVLSPGVRVGVCCRTPPPGPL